MYGDLYYIVNMWSVFHVVIIDIWQMIRSFAHGCPFHPAAGVHPGRSPAPSAGTSGFKGKHDLRRGISVASDPTNIPTENGHRVGILLVVWNMTFIFTYIGNVIIPIDYSIHIFQMGWNHQPVSHWESLVKLRGIIPFYGPKIQVSEIL